MLRVWKLRVGLCMCAEGTSGCARRVCEHTGVHGGSVSCVPSGYMRGCVLVQRWRVCACGGMRTRIGVRVCMWWLEDMRMHALRR